MERQKLHCFISHLFKIYISRPAGLFGKDRREFSGDLLAFRLALSYHVSALKTIIVKGSEDE